MEIWQKLSKSKIFEGIDEAGIKALNFCFKSRIKLVDKNEIICYAGEKNDFCAFILSGKAKSVNYDYLGIENIIKYYHEGEIFGLSEAYTQTESYLTTLVATEKSEILLFNQFRFTKPCENRCPRHIQMEKNLTKLLAQSNYEMALKINILSKRTIRDKVMAYLNMISKYSRSNYFDIPLNRQELANYLAVDRSALSIELSKMKKDGLIDYNKNHFHLI
ncbi:MAG: Crp/Fnr family transcriptional regulator [Clostridia bacterium]|nr:Crp/Fnr family transcriptional regulator [Clostridia bacterium]